MMASHPHLRAPVLPFPMLAEAIKRLSRPDIENLTESLIDLLDTLDGDPDLEDDDPAGGNVEDAGEMDETRGLPLPRYGIDQTREPINAKQVWSEWYFDGVEGRCVHRREEWAR